MENAWNEYSRLERDVDWLKSALQGHMSRSDLSQVSAPVISVNTHKQLSRMGVCGNELQRTDFICTDKAKSSVCLICLEDRVSASN